ncbi:MAG: FAD-dependent oxidoreductase [Peptococcaceae bacterium]|nr:FAD-dependent oxidoreductase [Peptococcaceae bacterium]
MSEVKYDLIILGGGPAGLAAGIYGGRARLNTLILEKGTIGGRAETTREIVNYPGVPQTTGPDLTNTMREHAEKFGVTILKESPKEVILEGEEKVVKTRKNTYTAPAIILATGTSARILGIPGEKEFAGAGVAYCATCDAEFFQDQRVCVIGSGDQAIEESMFIAKFASEVTIIVLHEEGVLDCNKVAAEKAFAHPKLKFVWNSVPNAILGDDDVNTLQVKNVKTDELTDIPCEGVFFFVGQVPETKGLTETGLKFDERGYILTNDRMETNLEGVYAVGDVRQKYLRQVVTSAADGAIAATAAERYIEEVKDFNTRILGSDKPVLLAFWSQEYDGSLEAIQAVDAKNAQTGDRMFVEVDYMRKKTLAKKFDITLSEEKPAVIIELVNGKMTREVTADTL